MTTINGDRRSAVREPQRAAQSIIRSARTSKAYAEETVGLVAKVPNPWRPDAWILLLAGLHYPGTIASLLAVTEFTDLVLKGYDGGPWYRIVQGLDRDGDGRLDDVQVLE